MSSTYRSLSLGCFAMVLLCGSTATAVPEQIEGDFNVDGIVSHADYSVLGDGWGSMYDASDFATYVSQYGMTASQPSSLPFSITPSPTVDGNVEWTLAFSNVNGALAGHLDIEVSGADILSATPGSQMLDDGSGMAGVPGPDFLGGETLDMFGNPTGITIYSADSSKMYAALGTTLGASFTNQTLVFLTMVTEGQGPTEVRVLGGPNQPASEYGYGGQDFFFPSHVVGTYSIPEPPSAIISAAAALLLMGIAIYQRQNSGYVIR